MQGTQHSQYMHRCLQLARLATGNTFPNPLVGAVLVHNHRIIGEGFHYQAGLPHAEVNCINSVAVSDKHLIPHSTLYVSLEPCAHFGKTPPCSHLIIQHKIPRVVIGCTDNFALVAGKGIEQLKAAGIEVLVGVLEHECWQLNRSFFYYQAKKLPLVTAKWAATANGKAAGTGKERILITNAATNIFMHQLRATAQAIVVGASTVVADNPLLTVRWGLRKSPMRFIWDRNNICTGREKVFLQGPATLVFVKKENTKLPSHIQQIICTSADGIDEIITYAAEQKLHHIWLEGGPTYQQLWLQANAVQVIYTAVNNALTVPDGLPAPTVPTTFGKEDQYFLGNCTITQYQLLHA
ncbi:MAG: bifunctional diaminohydroxyphosphoribosylaminopyrimidine deaminase/5-amino-6-(5-phosphoribosylamino)uracil reductase RibD [Bacteroidetes bacterium]|nr:MAG: bifunctional diaminohydroxyphosphoribosylaminopyrimidine deaminase/5-amino-6-(5-phosphoribosylamino)uracil reductase RibD [Bacteroidota bacterium]